MRLPGKFCRYYLPLDLHTSNCSLKKCLSEDPCPETHLPSKLELFWLVAVEQMTSLHAITKPSYQFSDLQVEPN